MAPPTEPLLAPERIPFPVEPRYLIRPDLRKLQPGQPRFVVDARWPSYLERKLELLTSDPGRCRVIGGDEDRIHGALQRVAGSLSEEHPELCRLDGRSLLFPLLGLALDEEGGIAECGESATAALRTRVAEHLEGLPVTARLADALALSVQEDLVLVAGPPNRDSAILLHVCFPSHWDPGERAGASFARLHQPVPHNERLLAGSRNMLAAMMSKGPFIRSVWSLTATPHLDQNPARPHGAPPMGGERLIDSLYFRSERQTTSPFDDFALFTIRIYVSRLRRVLDPNRAALLATAIRSMDADLLRYKSLTAIREPLLAELDELARG